jgi:prefoldin subunit 5
MSNIENDSQGSKARSPVIDLEAEDISPATDTGETEAPKEAEPEAPPPPPPPQRASLWTRNRMLGIAAVVAAILGAWLYREFGSDFWPPSSITALETRLGTLEASNRTLNEQLASLSGTFDALKAETAKLSADAGDKAGALEARFADMDKAMAELRQSIATLSASPGGSADPAALADLTRRIETLEQSVAALRDGGTAPPTTTTTGGGQDVSALSQALSDLKAKFAAGVAYKEELDRIAVHVPQNNDLADLSAHAEAGIANPQALASALEALVPSLASTGGGDAGAEDAGGFWAWVGTVVKVRDLTTLDWADLARSAAADAKAGDLKSAIARLEEPGGDLPPEVAEWRDRARLRLKLEGSLAQLAAAVTAIITGKS